MNNPPIKTLSPIITNLGDGAFAAGLFGGVGAYGLLFKDEKSFYVAKVGIEAFALTGIVCQVLKHTFSRERPMVATRDGGFWYGPFAYFNKSKGHGKGLAYFDAFPSGHATTAFSMATVFADNYDGRWIPYVSYSIASLVAVSRITERDHWMSDCFIGAIIGHYGTKLVEHWNSGSSSISMLPLINEHQYGVLLIARL